MTVNTCTIMAEDMTAVQTLMRDAKIAELVSLGVTDGICDTILGEGTTRKWATLEDANAWISFVNNLIPNSTTIISN